MLTKKNIFIGAAGIIALGIVAFIGSRILLSNQNEGSASGAEDKPKTYTLPGSSSSISFTDASQHVAGVETNMLVNAAKDLVSKTQCSAENPHQGAATLSWTLPKDPPEKERVQISIFGAAGFDDGRFEETADLSGTQTSTIITPLHGQSYHSWRVLTLHNGVWQRSDTGVFAGLLCISDTAK